MNEEVFSQIQHLQIWYVFEHMIVQVHNAAVAQIEYLENKKWISTKDLHQVKKGKYYNYPQQLQICFLYFCLRKIIF